MKSLWIIAGTFISALAALIVFVVIPETRSDDRREQYCRDQLHGFIAYTHGRDFCVDRNWHILSDWNGLKDEVAR